MWIATATIGFAAQRTMLYLENDYHECPFFEDSLPVTRQHGPRLFLIAFQKLTGLQPSAFDAILNLTLPPMPSLVAQTIFATDGSLDFVSDAVLRIHMDTGKTVIRYQTYWPANRFVSDRLPLMTFTSCCT